MLESSLLLVNQYGTAIYIILFAYCALKSGWLPLFAGYLAYAGALDIRLVALVTFAGGYLGDELRFSLAKVYGKRWLEKPNWFGKLFRRARDLADRYGTAYIFIYRYPKGLRTVGSLPIGLTDMSRRKFSLLNASSALLWVTVLVGGGYVFGETFDALGVDNLTAISLMMLCIFFISLYTVLREDSQQSMQSK